jgi:hypothetical protein
MPLKADAAKTSPAKKPHGKTNATETGASHKPGHGAVNIDDKNIPAPIVVIPPNPKLLDKLSFGECTTTPDEVDFPRFLQNCGILDMIMHTFARLEREKPRPADPWEWMRYRFFLGSFNPGDKDTFRKTLAELTLKRDKLVKERNDVLRGRTKRDDTAAGSKLLQ